MVAMGFTVDNHTLALGLCPCTQMDIDHKSLATIHAISITYADENATLCLVKDIPRQVMKCLLCSLLFVL